MVLGRQEPGTRTEDSAIEHVLAIEQDAPKSSMKKEPRRPRGRSVDISLLIGVYTHGE
jgi:hypothetical protein